MARGWEFPEISARFTGPLAIPPKGQPFALLYDGVAGKGVLLSAPIASISGREDGIALEVSGHTWSWPGNPLDHLDAVFSAAVQETSNLGHDAPCFAGAFHYDLRRLVERFAHPSHDDLRLPWVRWFLFSTARPVSGPELTALPLPHVRPPTWFTAGSLDRPAFKEGVRRIVDLEYAGEVYQVNLTRRLTAPLSCDPFSLWWGQARTSRAPFAAYLDEGSFQLLSLSPERFLRREGGRVWTEPIKGTVSRGATPEADSFNRAALLAGEKEAAELAMIVDVSRNDLGRVAVPGSVRLAAHREVLTLPHVHHLVSRVEAELRPGTTVADLLWAAFPGASVTGAPKIRAMEIIDALEPVSRGFYCGALGWMDPSGDLDWSLPIRTSTAVDGHLHLGVGGGIVADSDPSAEWEETVAKARCFVGE